MTKNEGREGNFRAASKLALKARNPTALQSFNAHEQTQPELSRKMALNCLISQRCI